MGYGIPIAARYVSQNPISGAHGCGQFVLSTHEDAHSKALYHNEGLVQQQDAAVSPLTPP
jgi:hypothetical protein